MTVKLVVLYTRPDDVEAFEKHYLDVHAPLVERLPGLLRWEGVRLVAAPDGGDLAFHRMAELWFEDQAALDAALGSEAGEATAADYGRIAPPGSRMFVAVTD